MPYLRKFFRILKKGFVGSTIVAMIVLVYGTFSEFYIENQIAASGIHTLFESLWWVMQTITTVGYGDTTILGFWGRLNAMLIMIFGIGSLGYLLASVSANIVNSNFAERLGGVRARMRDHVIVCNYNATGKELIRKMNRQGFPVVLISPTPVNDPGLEFQYIRGSCLDGDILERGGIRKSDAILVLSGKYTDSDGSMDIDARTIVMGMNAKRRNPEIRVITELIEMDSEEHARAAGIDQAIIRGKFSTEIMGKAIFSPGVASMVEDLISDSGDYVVEEHALKSLQGAKAEEAIEKYSSDETFILGYRKGKHIEARLEPDDVLDFEKIIILRRK